MSHRTFLHRYRNLIRTKFIFGLCPVGLLCVDPLQKSPNTLEAVVTDKTTAYTTVHSLLVTVIYFCLYIFETLKQPTYTLSGTRSVTIFLEHTTVFVMFTAVLFVSWRHRRRHARLLNTIASVIDRMETYTRATRPPLNVTALNVQTGAWLLVCFTLTFSTMAVFGQFAITAPELTYYVLLNGAICNLFAAVLQVRNLVGLLADVQMACVETLTAQHNSTMVVVDADFGDQQQTIIVLMDDVQRCAVDVMHCFGALLLLCKAKDFIFLTTIAFYIVAELAFSGYGPDWIMLYLVMTYLVPIMLNELLLVRAFGRLNRGMESFKRALCERKCLADEWLGLETIFHQTLHAEHNQLLVYGLFPINNSLLYKMIAGVFSYLLVLMQFQQWEENQLPY